MSRLEEIVYLGDLISAERDYKDVDRMRKLAYSSLNDAMLAAWNAIPPTKPKNYCAYLLRLVRNAAYNRYCAAHTLKRNAANTASSIDELAEIIPDKGDAEREEWIVTDLKLVRLSSGEVRF